MLEKGPRRFQVLVEISNANTDNPIGSDLICKKLLMQKSNVIRIIDELEAKGAIKCVTGRKRDRLFRITKKGRTILDLLRTKYKQE